ncbi:MAG: hypothetical protein MJ168_05415 [Clostridia bacterium]|nr:hypothetical protein [Clostridia bacterium]
MALRIIDTGNDVKCLTGDNHPQLKIGDKLYLVDDRKSTYDKIQEISQDEAIEKKDEKILELALGKDACKELLTDDISVQEFQNLSFFVMSAITGEEYEKLKEAALERKN